MNTSTLPIPVQTAFEQRALPMIARNVPVIPLKPNSKIAFINDWQSAASTEPGQIKRWAQMYPDANVASVAKAVPGAVFFFEIDKQDFAEEIEKQTGQKMPETFMVRSRPGR